LTNEEIIRTNAGGSEIFANPQQVIFNRREERELNIKIKHPQKVYQRGDNWYPYFEGEEDQTDSLKGIGCSAGTAVGRVKIIMNPDEFTAFEKGSILVTRSTNPGWTPLFVLAGAVVTEIGGALSHGAIIAREYGLPMAAAIPDALTKLKDGDMVEVNGHNGVVKILT